MKSIVLEYEIWDFLRTVTEGVANAFRPIVEEHGLTLMQTRILLEIKECGKHTVGSLGGIIGLASGNSSSMCKKLEKAGFVQRIRNPEDERYVQLALTQAGEAVLQQIGDALERTYGSFMQSKKDEEFQEIFTCMKTLSLFIREMGEFSRSNDNKQME